MASNDQAGGVSTSTDNLTCELIGEALDKLAVGDEVLAVASVCDEEGNRLTCEFADDGPEVCVDYARSWVRDQATDEDSDLGELTSFAIVYEGAVEDESGAYLDALISEFGDAGAPVAYSGYMLVEGIGEGENLRWTDPEPAGELPPIL